MHKQAVWCRIEPKLRLEVYLATCPAAAVLSRKAQRLRVRILQPVHPPFWPDILSQEQSGKVEPDLPVTNIAFDVDLQILAANRKRFQAKAWA